MSLASNDLLNEVQEEKYEEGGRLATVVSTSTSDNVCRAIVRFYGEEEDSSIEYPVVYSSEPSVGDVVVLQKVGSSMAIMGKLKKDNSGLKTVTNYKTTSSVSAGTVKIVEVGLEIPSGYQKIGVNSVWVSTGSTSSTISANFIVMGFALGSNTITVVVKNTSSSAATGYVRVSVNVAKLS